MANKEFKIQGNTLSLGGVALQAGTTSVVIPGVTQATSYKVDEVNDSKVDVVRINEVKYGQDFGGVGYYNIAWNASVFRVADGTQVDAWFPNILGDEVTDGGAYTFYDIDTIAYLANNYPTWKYGDALPNDLPFTPPEFNVTWEECTLGAPAGQPGAVGPFWYVTDVTLANQPDRTWSKYGQPVATTYTFNTSQPGVTTQLGSVECCKVGEDPSISPGSTQWLESTPFAYSYKVVKESDPVNASFGSDEEAITVIDSAEFYRRLGEIYVPSASYVAATYSVDSLENGNIEEVNVDSEGVFSSTDKDYIESHCMWASTDTDPLTSFNWTRWTQIPFTPKLQAGEIETLGGGTADTGDVTFDGVKIIGAGTASGDGYGNSTLELVPDAGLYENDQYLVIDPTVPNHIHIRAGGTQDASNAQLFLGGEKNNVRVQDSNGVYLTNQSIRTTFTGFTPDVQFTDFSWYTFGGLHYIDVTTTDATLIANIQQWADHPQNEIEVSDSTNTYFTNSAQSISQQGDTYTLWVTTAAPEGFGTVTQFGITLATNTVNEMYLANNDFRVDVADDVRMFGGDLFRLVNTSTTNGIEITTDDNNASHVWVFGADGNLSLPTTSQIIGDIVTVKGTSSVTIKVPSVLNPFDTKDWGFDGVGRMSFPDGTLQTTAYTGSNALSTVAKTGNPTPLAGEVSTVTLNPTNNTNFTPGVYPGIFLGLGLGFTITLTVAENGDLTAEVISSNSGFVVGDIATLNGGAITGGTTGVDDVYVTVASITNVAGPTELDLTKSVQKLTDGYYILADGVEGQVMHLVRQTGSTFNSIFIDVTSGRAGGVEYTGIAFYPFDRDGTSNNQLNMTTLLFTDGAWQSDNGTWD